MQCVLFFLVITSTFFDLKNVLFNTSYIRRTKKYCNISYYSTTAIFIETFFLSFFFLFHPECHMVVNIFFVASILINFNSTLCQNINKTFTSSSLMLHVYKYVSRHTLIYNHFIGYRFLLCFYLFYYQTHISLTPYHVRHPNYFYFLTRLECKVNGIWLQMKWELDEELNWCSWKCSKGIVFCFFQRFIFTVTDTEGRTTLFLLFYSLDFTILSIFYFVSVLHLKGTKESLIVWIMLCQRYRFFNSHRDRQ